MADASSTAPAAAPLPSSGGLAPGRRDASDRDQTPAIVPGGIKRVMLVPQSAAVGGMETHCIDLAAEYVRRGITVLAVVPEQPDFDDVADRFRAAGGRVVRLDTDARKGRAWQLGRWWRVLRLMQRFRPDVVHVHTGGATGGLAVVGTARLATRATVVLTEHDVPSERPGIHLRLTKPLLDRAAHAVIAVSRRNANLRVARLGGPSDRLAAILNGVPIGDAVLADRAQNRQQIRRELGIEPTSIVLGSVVRLAEGKGLRDLLHAMPMVLQAHACELLLVGDGPLRHDLESLAARLGVERHVHFAGQRADPQRWMDAMDVFVLPVPAGSMSIALLEAMARGVPPVITFCGPEEAVIPDVTGLGAPPNDPRGLAESLTRIVRDAALREHLGTAAEAHVRHHFSVARVADDVLAVYVAARHGEIPPALRADAPFNPYPGRPIAR